MATERRPRSKPKKMKPTGTRAKRSVLSRKDGAHSAKQTPASLRRANAGSTEATDERHSADCLVIGVQGQAGGLDALMDLFGHVLLKGLAFIVVQHLARDPESILPQLLARQPIMGVVFACDG